MTQKHEIRPKTTQMTQNPIPWYAHLTSKSKNDNFSSLLDQKRHFQTFD